MKADGTERESPVHIPIQDLGAVKAVPALRQIAWLKSKVRALIA